VEKVVGAKTLLKEVGRDGGKKQYPKYERLGKDLF